MLDINNFTTVHEKKQQRILATVERDSTSLRLSVLVAVQIPTGEISEPVSIQRSRLLAQEEKALEWLKDYDLVYDEGDLKTIRDNLLGLLKKPDKIVCVANKATEKEVLEELLEYTRIYADERNEDKKNADERIKDKKKIVYNTLALFKDGRYYLKSTLFEMFVANNKRLGWNKFEILKMLKRNGLLDVGKDRSYDKKVKINRVGQYYYVIKIPQGEDGKALEMEELIGIDMSEVSEDAV